jgi:hypothetical protein
MKISDKLKEVNDSITIYRYDNGYMVDVSGRDSSDDYKNARICVSTIEEVTSLVNEFSSMKIND